MGTVRRGGVRGGRAIAALLMAAVGAVRGADAPVVISGPTKQALITISKETTVITEPRREDGGVDYVGAMNRRYGTGVKPEENGFVPWVGLVGQAGLGPDGQAAARMAGRDVPAEAEAWVPMRIYARDQEGLTGANVEAACDQVAACGVKVWKAEECPVIARFLEASEEKLAVVRESMRRPKWWIPKTSKEGRLMDVLLVTLSTSRDVAGALCARATLRGGAGDFEGFLEDVLTVKKLARRMTGEFVIGVLVGCAIDAMADRAIGAVAGRGELTAAQYAALEKALAALPRIDGVEEAVDVAERWNALDFVQMVAAGEVTHFAEMLGGEAAILRGVDPASVDWDVVLRGMNASLDESLKIVKTEDPQARAALVAARKKRQDAAWPGDVGDLPQSLMLVKKARESRAAYSLRVLAAMERFYASNLEHIVDIRRRTWLSEDLGRLVVAAGTFKAREGRWPQGAEELVPRDIAGVPLDLVGKPALLAAGKQGVMATGSAGTTMVSVGVKGE